MNQEPSNQPTYATAQNLTGGTATPEPPKDSDPVIKPVEDKAGLLEKAFGKPKNRKQQRRLDHARKVTVGMFMDDQRSKEAAKEKRRKKDKEAAKAKARNRK